MEATPPADGRWKKVQERYRDAHGGFTVAQLKTTVDAWLATQVVAPAVFLVNVGINDRTSPPSQASFEADYGYMLDAIHTKWPVARVLVQQVWARGADAVCDTLDGYIANVVAARSSYVAIAGDERVYLKGVDNGASETMADGIHPLNFGALTGPGYPDGMAGTFVTAIRAYYP